MTKNNNNAAAAAMLKLAIAPSTFNGKALKAGDFSRFGGFGVCRAGGKTLAKDYLARVSAMDAGTTEAVHALKGGKCSAALRCVLAVAAHDAQAMISASTAAHIAATTAERAATDKATEEARSAASAKSAALRKLRSACELFAASHDGMTISETAKEIDFINFAVSLALFPVNIPDGMTAAEKVEALKSAAFATNSGTPEIALAALELLNAVEKFDNAKNAAARARAAEESACLAYYNTESDLIAAVKAAQEFARANPEDGKAADALKAARSDLEAFRAVNAD